MLVCKDINYYDGDTCCKGQVSYDNSGLKKKPAVLIAHDWGGRGLFACEKSKQLASLGYVGFALDMYGNAQLGQDKVQNRALMTPLMTNRQALIQRITAALTAISELPQVDNERIAVIGYCFGGLCALDLARSGAAIRSAVSFHGLLMAPPNIPERPIHSKILILHGYDDPLVKPDQVHGFAEEMNRRKADWQIHMYGRTQHSFTNPEANDDEMGLHYNEVADKRSWVSTTLFLQETLS